MLLEATASDDVGVTRVEFYVNGTYKGSDTSAPYAYTWDRVTTTANDGAHTDSPPGKSGTVTYRVCEAGTSFCSNDATVF